MTNEEARSNLEKLLQLYDDGMIDFSIIRERIEALSKSSEIPNSFDDVISKQAAIDAMANTLWHYPNECYRNLNEYEFAKGLAELGLKSVPSAQQEQHWIPCGERLPDTNRDVLLQFDINMGVGFWENGEWGVSTGDNIYSEIGKGEAQPIAWMELPEPYKGEYE